VTSILLYLTTVSARPEPEAALAAALTVTFGAYLVSAIRTLICIIREARGNRRNTLFTVFLSGDIVLLAIGTFLPGGFGRIILSILFIHHFVCLFVILKLVWPVRAAASLSEEEKTARFISAGLSKRESEIALALVKGYSYGKIADIHCISLSTVQTHVSRIYGKLGVRNKTALAVFLENR